MSQMKGMPLGLPLSGRPIATGYRRQRPCAIQESDFVVKGSTFAIKGSATNRVNWPKSSFVVGRRTTWTQEYNKTTLLK